MSIGLFLLFQFSACNCNAEGSNGITCDDSGVCSCKANIVNDKCDACNAGFFNFPTCSGKQHYVLNYYKFSWCKFIKILGLCLLFLLSACTCNAQGSSGVTCDDSGVCSCNANIGGDKCDACNAGFFNFPTCSGKQYYVLLLYYLYSVESHFY